MKVKAQAKNLRISPRKLGLVAALIRRRRVEEALTILDHTPKRGADLLRSVLKSAVANAEQNLKLNPQELMIDSVLVGPGPTLRRYRPAPHGRAHRIRRRSSHVTVWLDRLPSTTKAQEAK